MEALMSLRRSPARTPALLAANRANSLKSTGPLTERGKARVSFNSFKHGRYAVRPEELAERLVRAGYCREAALYRQVRWQIGQVFRPQSDAGWDRVYRLSAWAWSFRSRLGQSRGPWGVKRGAKPECGVFSIGSDARLTSRTGIRVQDPYRRIGIAFWIQRRRYWNPEKIRRVVLGLDPLPGLEKLRALEGGLRCRVYRMRKPRNWDERLRYGLDRDGNFQPELYLAYRRKLREHLREGRREKSGC